MGIEAIVGSFIAAEQESRKILVSSADFQLFVALNESSIAFLKVTEAH